MGEHLGSYDAVFALNVVEHIQDDSLALKNIKKLLKPSGKCVILVPAYQTLYNRFDKELEHYRRYTKSTLKEKMREHYKIIHSQYFNAAGIAGWVSLVRLLRKKTIPSGQMKLYNKLVPFKIGDKVLLNQIGLSVIVIGEKNDAG